MARHIKDSIHYKGRTHLSLLSDAVEEMYRSKNFADVVINIKQEQFICHKNILSAVSSYFYTMFTTGLKERSDREINLIGIEPRTFQDILQYIYLGTVNIGAHNAIELLHAADMYDIEELKQGCTQYYSIHLDESSCLVIWNLAKHLNNPELQQLAFRIATSRFVDVVQVANDDFVDLSVDDIVTYLGSEDLKVENEEQVLVAALKWLEEDLINKSQYFYQVISVVRLTDIDPKVLEKKYLINKYIISDKKVSDMVLGVIDHQLYNSTLSDKVISKSIRNQSEFTYDIVVLGGSKQFSGNRYNETHAYKISTNNAFHGVEKMCSLPTNTGTAYLASCIVGNCIYISGLGEYNNEVWCYDLHRDQWFMFSSMKNGRHSHAMMIGPKFNLYILGGYKSLKAISSIEECKSNEKDGQWKEIGNLEVGVGSFSATYFNNSFYVFGGKQDFQDALDIIQRYDLKKNTCTVLSIKLPSVSAMGSLVTWMNHAILVTNIQTVVLNMQALDCIATEQAGKLCSQKYDQINSPVFLCKENNLSLQGFQAVIIGTKVYVIGGEYDMENGPKICSDKIFVAEVEDIVDRRKRKCPWVVFHNSLHQPLAFHSCVVLKSKRENVT